MIGFKRFISVILAVLTLASLVGCGSGGKDTVETEPIRDDPVYEADLSGYDISGTIEIDPAEKFQLIQGFGGINYPGWIDDLSEDQRKTAFLNGEDQLGFSILRIHVDPDRNNWEKELETAKYAYDLGVKIFASPWNPPADMCEKFNHNGNANAQRLRHDKYAEYAQHLNDFVTFMREGGVELYAISIQNEPDYADEWTWWSTEEIIDFIKNYSDVIDCRVMSPEAFQYRKDFYNAILNDEEALSKIDVFGTHFYGTQKQDMRYPLFEEKGEGKELWMTEVYVPNSDSDADTYPEAVEVAINMHDGLVTGNMQAYVWWYIRRFYGPMKEDGTISKRGYMMAHYSKFVRPGYQRIGATENPTPGIMASAYMGEGRIAVVIINHTLSKYAQKLSLKDIPGIEYVESYRTDYNGNLERTGNIKNENGEFSVELTPESVTTVVIDLADDAQEE